MWLFGSNQFLSIVQDPVNRDNLVVRARREGDIQTIFPFAVVRTLPGRDYQFRANLSRERVAEAMHKHVMEINYGNFKDSVRDHEYHNACSRVWGVMAGLQEIPPYSTTPRRKQTTMFLGNEE
jgi:hypothetical protein